MNWDFVNRKEHLLSLFTEKELVFIAKYNPYLQVKYKQIKLTKKPFFNRIIIKKMYEITLPHFHITQLYFSVKQTGDIENIPASEQ